MTTPTGGEDVFGTTAGDAPPLRLVYMSPDELSEHPSNWRRHSTLQKDAIAGALDEVGWAGALLYNTRSCRLIDGHARRDIALRKGIARVPVLLGDWSEADETKILLTLDPLGAMAQTDPACLDALLRDAQTADQALATLLTRLAEEAELIPSGPAVSGAAASPSASPAGDGTPDRDRPEPREATEDEAEAMPEPSTSPDTNTRGVFALRVVFSTAKRRDDFLVSLRAEGHDCDSCD